MADANIIASWLYEKGVSKFDTKWKTFKQKADKLNEQNIVDIDLLLAQFMYINRATKGENSVTLVGLRSYFKNSYWEKTSTLLTDKPTDLVDKLTDLASAWEIVMDFECVWLALKFNHNIKYFLGTFLSRFSSDTSGNISINENEVKPFVETLCKLFAVLLITDTSYSSKNFKQFLFKENIKIADQSVSISEIITDIKNHIHSIWKKDEIKNSIATFDSSKNLSDANDSNTLVFLNDYLYAKKLKKPLPFKSSVNVEHILPQSGRNVMTIRTNAGLVNDDEFKLYVNSIGNKILLEESINKKIGNDFFTDKIQSFIPVTLNYCNSQFPLAQALLTYKSKNNKQEWTKNDINDASDKAAQRIADFIFS